MSTTTIEGRCNARPTRLAFVVSKPDRDQLNAVFARASTLWGGLFNPIVILDDETRKTSGIHYTTLPPDPYLSLQADMLKAFDPDLLITYSADPLPEELFAWKHRTLPSSQLDWNPGNRGVKSYFVDVFPVLNDLWNREFKGFEKSRVKIKYVEKAEAEKSLFIAARFGLYPDVNYYETLRQYFRAEPFVYDANFMSSHWPVDFLSVLAITAQHCRPLRQRLHSHAFFLLNPEDPFDVVDYWNLRAAGMYLFPITRANYQECAIPIRDFGAASAYPINERVTNHPTIIKAASITDEEQQEVTKWITSEGLVKDISMQGWVPHYFKEIYGVATEVEVDQVRGFEKSAIGVLIDGHGKVEGPTPSFLAVDNAFEHWSMDLSLWTFRLADACYAMPWLNSGCDALAARRIGSLRDIDSTRISRQGIVSRQEGNSGDIRIEPVRAVDVVRAFLQGVDVKYLETSTPGLALDRILEMMNGFQSSEIFRNAAIRETLEELSNGGNRLAAAVTQNVIKSLRDYKFFGRPASQQQKCERADVLLSLAIHANVLRVGLVFQCSRCRRHNWYAVTEFDRNYGCKSCFSREETPRLDKTKWCYASDGLFRSANKLDGNMVVLLTLAFFDELLDHDLRFAPSFDYRLNDEQHEMDFAIIASESLRPNVDIVFGESKSSMPLNDEERKKVKQFAEKAGTYICFCTLADDFEAADKEYFKELYENGVKITMLTRLFLQMDSFELSDFQSHNNAGRSATKVDWLMRLTIIRTLGDEFARKHYVWI